jgi:hypothetical protein
MKFGFAASRIKHSYVVLVTSSLACTSCGSVPTSAPPTAPTAVAPVAPTGPGISVFNGRGDVLAEFRAESGQRVVYIGEMDASGQPARILQSIIEGVVQASSATRTQIAYNRSGQPVEVSRDHHVYV